MYMYVCIYVCMLCMPKFTFRETDFLTQATDFFKLQPIWEADYGKNCEFSSRLHENVELTVSENDTVKWF